MKLAARTGLGVALLVALCMWVQSPTAFADRLDPQPDVSLRSMKLSDFTVHGHLPSMDIWFTGYGDYRLAEDRSYLSLEYDHSELVRPSDSTLTVLLNDVPVGSVFLTPENTKRTVWRIPLPSDKLKRDLNHVQLKYLMRIRDDDCVNQENPGLWSTIFDTTSIHYQYQSPPQFLALPAPDLARLPEPFFRKAVADDDIAVVIPDQPTSVEFSAAASVAARFGQWATGKPLKTSLYYAGQLGKQLRSGRDLVVIGRPGTNSVLDELMPQLPLKAKQNDQGRDYVDESGSIVAPDSGIIQEIISPWDERCSILIVSGGNDEGLRRAVRTLSSRLGMKALQGPYAVVTRAEEELRRGEKPSDVGSQMGITLEQLGFDDLPAKGAGPKAITFTMDTPPIDSGAGAYFDMNLSYSPLLDPVLSSVTVSLNGVQVRSLNLKPEGSQRTVQRITLPPGSLKPGPNSVTILFALYLRGSEWYCMPLADERAWGVLHRDSAFVLPVGPDPPTLDLANFPYPFVKNGSPLGTYLVLPEDPTMFQDSLNVAAALGRQSLGDSTEMEAGLESQLTEEIRKKYELAIYGVSPNSGILTELGPQLPLELGGDSQRSLQKPESVLLGVKDAANLGIIELIPSPWNQTEKAVLVVSGTSAETARRSPQALEGRLPAGNIALITLDEKGENKVASIKMAGKTVRQAADSPAQRQRRLYTIAAIPAVFLIIGMLGLMIFRSARRP